MISAIEESSIFRFVVFGKLVRNANEYDVAGASTLLTLGSDFRRLYSSLNFQLDARNSEFQVQVEYSIITMPM